MPKTKKQEVMEATLFAADMKLSEKQFQRKAGYFLETVKDFVVEAIDPTCSNVNAVMQHGKILVNVHSLFFPQNGRVGTTLLDKETDPWETGLLFYFDDNKFAFRENHGLSKETKTECERRANTLAELRAFHYAIKKKDGEGCRMLSPMKKPS